MNEGYKIKGKNSDKILIFDLDDTLIISDAKIKVLDAKSQKVIKELTPAQYNSYVEKKGQLLNFDEFKDFGILKKSKLTKYMGLLKQEYLKGTHICILTARDKSNMIYDFFMLHGIKILPQLVIATGDPKWNLVGSVAERKKQAINKLINQGYTNLTFFDDNEDNIKFAKNLNKEYPDVSIKTVKV